MVKRFFVVIARRCTRLFGNPPSIAGPKFWWRSHGKEQEIFPLQTPH